MKKISTMNNNKKLKKIELLTDGRNINISIT